ncbi:MAG TPA: hypothetical protein VJB82_00385 [Candidatus Peribacterales bacterium]|nr:hypothetical protein [Candidatus Peribacterales bacterium]
MNDPDINQRLHAIEQRNRRVEAEKAWERSLTRMITLGAMTYGFAALFLFLTDIPQPFLNAFVPVVGFILSLQTLPLVKKHWIRKKET